MLAFAMVVLPFGIIKNKNNNKHYCLNDLSALTISQTTAVCSIALNLVAKSSQSFLVLLNALAYLAADVFPMHLQQ